MDGTQSKAGSVRHEDAGLIETSYTCFVVRAWDDDVIEAVLSDNNTLVSVLEGDLLINAADQWGPYSVTTRRLGSAPGEPAPEWEDVVEVSISSASPLVVTELVENDPRLELTTEPGEYRLRVSARGRRVPDGDPEDDFEMLDDEPPKEWYLLEVWPAPATEPVIERLSSPFAQHTLNPPAPLVIPEGEAGLAAAGRIGRDVSRRPGARSLSGELGSVRAERTIRGTRRRLFRWCAHLTSWSAAWVGTPSWDYVGGPNLDQDEYAPDVPHWAFSHTTPDQLTGEHGSVRHSFVEVDKPHRAVREWEWLVSPSDTTVSMDQLVPFLAEPSRMTVTLTQTRDEAGEPWTTIEILHEQLPVEWLTDMETYWSYQLSIADHAGFGVPKDK